MRVCSSFCAGSLSFKFQCLHVLSEIKRWFVKLQGTEGSCFIWISLYRPKAWPVSFIAARI